MTPAQPPQRAHAALRKLVHCLVVTLGWVGFVWLWWLVSVRPWESERLVWLIAGSFILLPLLTGAWVVHNRSIFNRKGERLAVAVAQEHYANDWHGREVQADWPRLKRSRLVHIGVYGGRKIYRVERADARSVAPPPAFVQRSEPPVTARHATRL